MEAVNRRLNKGKLKERLNIDLNCNSQSGAVISVGGETWQIELVTITCYPIENIRVVQLYQFLFLKYDITTSKVI